MNNPAISVIIPVYNAEKFLRPCLESLSLQPVEAMEVLMIDDGSKDGSGAICDEFAAVDLRFRAIHIPNGGVSGARNLGLDNARGEVVTFVDADDYVSPSYAETILAEMLGEGKERVDFLAYQVEIVLDGRVTEVPPIPAREADTEDEVVRLALTLKEEIPPEWNMLGFPWNKAFRRDIIERFGLRFAKGLSYREDELFIWHYLRHTRIMRTISDTLYGYRLLNGLSAKGRVISAETWCSVRTHMDAARWDGIANGLPNASFTFDILDTMFFEAKALLREGGDWKGAMRSMCAYYDKWHPGPHPGHRKVKLALAIRVSAFWKVLLSKG